jgi:hypothetical protein
VPDLHQRLGNDFPGHTSLQTPAVEDLHHLRLAAFLHHQQHPLLGFREQVFPGSHAAFPRRHSVEVKADPHPSLGGHFRSGAGEASRPHILGSHHSSCGKGLQTGLDEALAQEGIPHLHCRPILLRILLELGAGKAGAADAIPPGGGAHVQDRVPHPPRCRFHHCRRLQQPQGHDVDQGIAAVAGIHRHFSPHCGYPDTVAVVGDPFHHPGHEAAVAGIC